VHQARTREYAIPATLREAIRAQLEAARVRVCAAICDHPRPVAGCDVEFNRLLEDRSRIVQGLAQLDALDRFELERFVSESPDIDAATRRRLRASLQQALAGG
jgi:hypothetical protein